MTTVRIARVRRTVALCPKPWTLRGPWPIYGLSLLAEPISLEYPRKATENEVEHGTSSRLEWNNAP
jgi:hypothetical protein